MKKTKREVMSEAYWSAWEDGDGEEAALKAAVEAEVAYEEAAAHAADLLRETNGG